VGFSSKTYLAAASGVGQYSCTDARTKYACGYDGFCPISEAVDSHSLEAAALSVRHGWLLYTPWLTQAAAAMTAAAAIAAVVVNAFRHPAAVVSARVGRGADTHKLAGDGLDRTVQAKRCEASVVVLGCPLKFAVFTNMPASPPPVDDLELEGWQHTQPG
jgi:hypothetical protein